MPIRYILIPAALIAFFLFFLDMNHGPRNALYYLYGLAHLLFFLIAARTLAGLPVIARKRFWLQFALILFAVFIVGGIIEIIQPYFGRTASWHDMKFNLLGGCLALLFLSPARLELRLRLRLSMQAIAIAMTGLIFYGPAITLWDMYVAYRQFPVLSDFETRFEAKRWTSGEINKTLARTGNASLRVELGTDQYAGTTLWRSFGNWEDYSALALSIYNPDEKPLEMTITIRDEEHSQRGGEYHDRFNKKFMLRQGWNDIRIPIGDIKNAPVERTMNLNRLTYVVIFAMNLPEPRIIFLDNVHLIPLGH